MYICKYVVIYLETLAKRDVPPGTRSVYDDDETMFQDPHHTKKIVKFLENIHDPRNLISSLSLSRAHVYQIW